MDRLLILMVFISSVQSEQLLTVQPGGNFTIPCFYDATYKQHKKYWCYHAAGDYRYCEILAYANTTEKKLTVTDYPDQSLFTVTMRDVQDRNAGRYWCAVEIGGIFRPDVKDIFHIIVKSDPDLSVVESSVSGQEGGSVSVQCLYSAGYKNKQKQWCRSKDWRCYTVGWTYTSQNSAVQIRDDGISSFSVVMSGLQKTDTGWYWCKTAEVQVPVHVSVGNAGFTMVPDEPHLTFCIA